MNPLSAFSSPFSAELVERLGWVLVHSVWQFALIALVASVAVRAMRRQSATARYAVLVGALALSVAAPLATGLLPLRDSRDSAPSPVAALPVLGTDEELNPQTNTLPPDNHAIVVGNTAPDAPAAELASPPVESHSLASSASETSASYPSASSWSERAQLILRPWLAWIVAGWSLGVALCSLRPLLGWYTLRRLKRVGISPVSGEVLAALGRVSARLGLRRAARIWQSTLAQVPVVVGYVRPVILLPVSLVTSMPTAQLEAILAHELAHVVRHDFVVNLLQTLVETLFFYHPAAWWLSHQIRVERENCCDDLVVALLGNRVEYGRALVAIEELRGKGSLLALGAGDGSLLGRIRRLVGRIPDQTRAPSWPVLMSVACFLVATVTVAALSWGELSGMERQNESPPEATDSQPQPAVGRDPDAAKGLTRDAVMTWSADSQHLFAQGLRLRLVRWKHNEGQLEREASEIPDNEYHAHAYSMAVSNKSGLTVLGTNRGTVQFWDGATLKFQKQIAVEPDTPRYATYAVAVSPDDHWLAEFGASGHLYEIATMKQIGEFGERDTLFPASMAFSPDGRKLAAIGRKGQLTLWSMPDGVELAKWQLWRFGERAVLQWSQTGDLIAVVRDGQVAFVTPQPGSEPRFVTAPEAVCLMAPPPGDNDDSRIGRTDLGEGIVFAGAMALSPDFKTVASVKIDSSVAIWNVETRMVVSNLAPPPNAQKIENPGLYLKRLMFSPDGRQLACQGLDGVAFWGPVDSKPPESARLRIHNADGSPARFNNVLTANVGFPKAPFKTWDLWPDRHGVVSLEGLPRGTHLLVAAADLGKPILFSLKTPVKQPLSEHRARVSAGWSFTDVECKATIENDDKLGEVIVIQCQNRSKERRVVSDEGVLIFSELRQPGKEHGELIRGFSPAWLNPDREPFVRITLEPGETRELRLNWRDWVRRGVWSSRNHEDIAEPALPPPEPGKLWVQVGLGGGRLLPNLVTAPEILLAQAIKAEPKQNAANLRDDDVEKFVLDTLRTPFDYDPKKGSWQGGAHEAQVLITLSLVKQQQRVLLALLNVLNRTEEASLDQRRLAMIYLGGAAPHQVLPILIRELEVAMAAPPERGFPYHEIEVLGQIGEKARAAIPVLIKLLDSPDQLARGGAMDALTKIGPSSTEVMNALAEHLDDPRAVYRLARYGELAKPLGPRLVETLDSKSPECRTWAAYGLVTSGHDAARGYEVLLKDLAAGSTENRSRSATALAALGSQAKEMIPKLREFENDRDEQVAKEVRDAIRRIEKDDRIFTHAEEAAKKAESYKAAAEAQKQLRAAAEAPADEAVEAPADEATAPPKGLEFLKPYKQLHGLSIEMTRKEFLALAKRHKLKFRESGGTYRVPTGDGHTVLVMFRKGSDKCTGIQRLRGEDPPEPGKAADGEKETKPAPDAESKNADPLQTKVSLAAEGMPLKLALTELARSAGLELQLNAEALKQVDLDVDEPVTTTIKDEPLIDALGTLIDWEAHQGAFRELRGRKLIITTLAERQEFIARHLPDWLQPVYNRGLLATLDDENQVVSITAGEAIDDELMGRIKTLPKLRELTIETTKRLSPKGLDALSAMASLEKLSFYSMRYDDEWLGDAIIERIVGLKALRELSLGECGVTDEGARRLEAVPQLTMLSLGNEGRLTDAALTSIGKLKNLKSLSLSSYVATVELGRMKFSADGIRRLIGLQQLEELHLVGQAVPAEALVFSRLKALSLGLDEMDDACAERIATLRDLRSLELVYTKITDDGLKKIAELPALTRLNLDSHVVTDAGIGHLKKLAGLQHISLRATHLTDASLAHLAEIKSLQRIDLNGSGQPGFIEAGECFSMRGVNELKALPQLRTLWLTNIAASGGYESLKDLKQLRELTLMMTDIRADEFKALEETLPNTRISHVTGGGGFSTEPRKKRAPKPGAAKPGKAEVSARLPDIRLTGDEVTPEAIAKLSDRDWGTITLADARFNGEIIERLRHVPSIHTLRLFGEGLSGQIPRLENVKGLVGLEISEPLKGRDLEAIAQLSNLESLSLPQEMTINVSGAREIAKLVKLKSLKLYLVNIDDAAFVELRTLVRLEELDLSHTRITDEGLATIVQMPLLRTLELHRYDTPQQLSDACLASIARLPELERLSLSGKVSDAGLKQVARWPKLKSLSITSTDITGDGLAALADSNVESLTLSTSQITEDRFLEPLKKCRKLKSIHVIGQPRGGESRWLELLPNIGWSFSS